MFIDGQADLDTVNYLSKSLNPEVMSKALDKTGLVQKEVQYQTKTGIATRKQWVKAVEEQPTDKQPKAQEQKKEPKPKREQVTATPVAITDKTKGMNPYTHGDPLPEGFEGRASMPIPPTWRNVMVHPDPTHEPMAVGKDDQNRPVYIYSQEYKDKKSDEKFDRVHSLMENKDKIVSFITGLHDIDPDSSDCLQLILHMGIRPGSTRDTKAAKEARGATTLKGENVVVEGDNVYLRFVGKKGVDQDHLVRDQGLAKMLVERKNKAGDDGDLFNTTSQKLRDVMPVPYHPKDLRTMLATFTAKKLLADMPKASNQKEMVKLRNQIGDQICSVLGNQRSMALSSYIDPAVFREHSPEAMEEWETAQKNKKAKKAA